MWDGKNRQRLKYFMMDIIESKKQDAEKPSLEIGKMH
jgi:hypothetical protein